MLDWIVPQREEWRSAAAAHRTWTSQLLATISKGRYIYIHIDNSFNWQVGGTTTVAMKLMPNGLSVNGTTVTSDKRLKFNAKNNGRTRFNKQIRARWYEQTYALVDQ